MNNPFAPTATRDPARRTVPPAWSIRRPAIHALVVAVFAIGCATQARPTPASVPPGILAGESTAAVLHVDQLLRRACYDCHSTESHAVWNAKIAFSYWFPSHVLDAVNFSAWQGYDEQRRVETRKAIADVVRSGDMPPVDYRVLHPSAKLTAEEKAAVIAWASGSDAAAR